MRSTATALKSRAAVFAALGDETRLAMLTKIGSGPPQSISRLTAGTRMSRQAVTKHLRVLEDVGVVRGIRSGRENLFEIAPKPINELRAFLNEMSSQWDVALARLKSFVEE
jgi:DNA-binding transcriptional ArsR family regulator